MKLKITRTIDADRRYFITLNIASVELERCSAKEMYHDIIRIEEMINRKYGYHMSLIEAGDGDFTQIIQK